MHLATFNVAGITSASKLCSCFARPQVRPIISRHFRFISGANYTSLFPALLVVITGRVEGILDIQWFHHLANSSWLSDLNGNPLHQERWLEGNSLSLLF